MTHWPAAASRAASGADLSSTPVTCVKRLLTPSGSDCHCFCSLKSRSLSSAQISSVCATSFAISSNPWITFEQGGSLEIIRGVSIPSTSGTMVLGSVTMGYLVGRNADRLCQYAASAAPDQEAQASLGQVGTAVAPQMLALRQTK
eukprot:CAMPEP_0183370882 /NCGR_PEP_ID=MMETSP0164_2-20130417/103762_1 /TAXON_ID=221442 /ORGANISM="Coccolithus pelagicus ssp braarudi, Strain PLY182g" /LENGTH=144 /DNA_ID=CAMNT_0025547359 /DNA_START=134 /DNA_END=569 /DNA_ORIENTATION=+